VGLSVVHKRRRRRRRSLRLLSEILFFTTEMEKALFCYFCMHSHKNLERDDSLHSVQQHLTKSELLIPFQRLPYSIPFASTLGHRRPPSLEHCNQMSTLATLSVKLDNKIS
jgi:hypothetical protein